MYVSWWKFNSGLVDNFFFFNERTPETIEKLDGVVLLSSNIVVFLLYFLFVTSVCQSLTGFPGLAVIEGPKSPPLSVLFGVARLHQQLVLGWGDGQALLTTAMLERVTLKENRLFERGSFG